MWNSEFCKTYGMEVPFVSAGMGFLALPKLAAAVSNAGGLGLLGVPPLPAPAMQHMISELRELTAKPFGVDLIHEETPLGELTTEDHLAVCENTKPTVAVFFWNLPPESWIGRLKHAGIKVWMTVGSLDGARRAVDAGVDALIVQGREAGGHVKSVGSLFALLPAIADAVAPVPTIAAGGIADGRGVAAAMILGAQAVCVGTRLVASEEAYAHDEYKRRIVRATVDDVTLTRIFGPEWPGQPMNVIRNRAVAEAEKGLAAAAAEPVGTTKMMGDDYPMPKHTAVLATPDTNADFEEMCLAAGESVGLVTTVEPVAAIIRSMMDEAKTLLGR